MCAAAAAVEEQASPLPRASINRLELTPACTDTQFNQVHSDINFLNDRQSASRSELYLSEPTDDTDPVG